jgi:hypothetical protein
VRETGLNQILMRFLLAKSPTRGLNVLKFLLVDATLLAFSVCLPIAITALGLFAGVACGQPRKLSGPVDKN